MRVACVLPTPCSDLRGRPAAGAGLVLRLFGNCDLRMRQHHPPQPKSNMVAMILAGLVSRLQLRGGNGNSQARVG